MTALLVLLWGYSFGVDDHAIHLAFIERARDPGFLPGDPMLAMAAKHPSVFFTAMAWLSSVMPIETVYFGAYLLSTFAMLFGLRMLGRSLWPGRGANWGFALALALAAVVPRIVAGGLTNFDPLFLPRVLSLGPLLIALALCVRGQSLLAFALTGLVFLFHATTAAHVAALLWMACAFCGRERLRALALGPIVFLLAASPLLIMMIAAGGSSIPTPAPAAWIDAVKLQYPFHHFDTPFVVIMQALWGTLAVLMAILCSPWKGAGRMLAGLLAGIWVLFAVGAVGNNVLRSPHTIQLHLFQAGRMLDYLALLSVVWFVYACFRRSKLFGVAALLPALTYILSTLICAIVGLPGTPQFAFAAYAILAVMFVGVLMTIAMRSSKSDDATAPNPRPAPRLAVAVGISALVVAAVAVVIAKADGPASHWSYDGTHLSGYPMMRWADAHLPADAVVMVPPYLFQPVASFRYFGRRRIVGSWKDGGEGTFDDAFQMQWADYMHRAFELPATVAPADHPQMLERVNLDFQRMPTDEIAAVAREYGATHIVREAGAPPLSLPQLYRDRDYALYRVAP
ncbi:MAG: hypothetical protein IT473_01915 [Lysobacter sp.]|nr:hypothetical protein [Lysobacter sp.]